MRESLMRLIAALFAFVLIAAAPVAEWREYVYRDQGFAIQFPLPPKVEKTSYRSQRYGQLPATQYSVTHESVQYKIMVAELGANAAQGANVLGEAAYWLMREGEVFFNDVPRVDQAQNGVFGLTMVMDLMDGRRMRTSIYVTGGRYYRVDAIVLTARGDKDMSIPSRFDQTLRFRI
jgi:hypothetical protein